MAVAIEGAVLALYKANLYKDSVALMRINERILALEGIRRATLVMGTGANKDILEEANMLPDGVQAAGPGDLIVVIESDTEAQGRAALIVAEQALEGQTDSPRDPALPARDLRAFVQGEALAPSAQLAQISVPGPYAAAEAMKALKRGCHVFLFSDNVSLAEECALKALAVRKGLLVMGPDCGTAILNGVPLGFANAVRRGPIGIVAASGTGLQEASTQIHLAGSGISHAIGTGGRDISAAVGGSTTLQGIDLLAADADTRVILVVSKPPSAAVTDRIMERLAEAAKPAVVLFIGSRVEARSGIHPASTLAEAVALAIGLAGGGAVSGEERFPPRPSFVASQKYIRALYSGGTFCYEAQAIWREAGLAAWSNAPLDSGRMLVDPLHSVEHTAIDLGDDRFTVGRPHPMIDPSIRIERLQTEARDKAVAVILLDVVLGYGSHPDPAGALSPAIREARLEAAREGRALAVVAFVCGTEEDPQARSVQARTLRDAGALVFAGSTQAAQAAARLVAK